MMMKCCLSDGGEIMALVYKCDRCSAIFNDTYTTKQRKRRVIYEENIDSLLWLSKGNRFQLCPACMIALENWCRYVPCDDGTLRYVKPKKKRWWQRNEA